MEKLKVVIVDDEERICQLIQALINWEEMGLQVEGMAHNGIDACEVVRKVRPDILITDIRMPGCSGLELIDQVKADLVEKARMYKNCAISVSGEVAPEARVAIAQAANDLLTIQGVDASFVAVQVGTGVNISARSLGAVNVQVIMESLGGGGHQTMAAAQLKHITPEAARARIEGAIDKYYASQKKGDVEGK